MNSVTTTVFAHGDVKETVMRHLPIWQSYTDNLLIVSPEDNPLLIPNIHCLTLYKRQHHGNHSLKRQFKAMKLALQFYDTEFYVFLEYDAIMLKRPEPRPIIQGNLFGSQHFHSKLINSPVRWLHFPWIFPKDKLIEFIQKTGYITSTENLEQDRWLANQLLKFDFQIYNLRKHNPPEGYSQNTITRRNLLELEKKHYNSIYAFHGIKTINILTRILLLTNNYRNFSDIVLENLNQIKLKDLRVKIQQILSERHGVIFSKD